MKNLKFILAELLLTILVFALNSCTSKPPENTVSSPDKTITVHFRLSDDMKAYYDIYYSDSIVMQDSRLGIIMEKEDFSNKLVLQSVSPVELVKDEYRILSAKKRNCSYEGNKRFFHLKNNNGTRMDIIFQVSNDGVAFRYFFPGKSNDLKKISKETSSFNFVNGTKAFIQPMSAAKSGWSQVNPSYEEYYIQDIDLREIPVSEPGWVFPALFKYNDFWMLLSETAPDRNYCGCRLKHDSATNEIFIGFPQEPEIFPGGALNPESALPWYSPWRIITIGKGLKTIVESTLGTDLAAPSRIKDASFVKPGRSSWSWVLYKDDSTIYSVQKKFVDYAADMGWEYCLVDADWNKKIGYNQLGKLAEYAKSKGVGILAWYNSSGEWNTTVYGPKSKLLTHNDRMWEFRKLRELGIKGVKVDYFGGDGQSMMAYYQDIFEDAAANGLMVNCHGATLPRGWQRTYPNLMTMEAVRGFEYVTFEQFNADHEPNHSCMQPFTRNVFDPMDFTPVCFSEVPGIKRITSNGFELALSVMFWSGLQHYAETPRGMVKVPAYVKDFLREVPSCWDDTKFVEGYPGKYVIIARRSGETWYMAGINGEDNEREINVVLLFVDNAGSYMIITDGKDKRSFDMKKFKYETGKNIKVLMKGYGGFVVKFE
jgi:alpha-glucosidase